MWRTGAALTTLGAILGVAACGTVLGLEDYEIVKATDTGDGCFDPARKCFTCEAGTQERLMNACTPSRCFPFDNAARIPGFDGAPPPLPPIVVDDTGTPSDAPPADTAVTDAPVLPLCSSFTNPVYVIGSTAMVGLLPALGKEVAKLNRTLVYQAETSCRGIEAINTGDTKLVPTLKTTAYGETATECKIEAPRLADIGISDVAPTRCPSVGTTATITDLRGPIQVFMFAAPRASTQRAISAEAAFRVFGFGAVAGIAPWLDDLFILRRHIQSGTQLTIGSFIGLPPDRWAGTSVRSSRDLAVRCSTSAQPEKTVCITSADQRDNEFLDVLRTLGYQHPGQTCAYLPDSDENSRDKRSVRDGHYLLWAPIHFYVRGTGAIPDDAVRDVMNALTGARPPVDASVYFKDMKAAGLVPACAMMVTRDTDDGPVKPVRPERPCGCAFETAFPGSAPTCKPCTDSTTCGADAVCSFGFCEAK